MALGLTDGVYNGGASFYDNLFFADPERYGAPLHKGSRNYTFNGYTTGITTDSTKSGIVTDTSSNVNYIIKY